MKKIFLALSLVFAMCLSACGNKYTVTFDSNGGSEVPSQVVEKGDKVKKPEDPTRNGYDFVNWTYQGEEWSFIGYVVKEDMTLLANWSIITYNITYELNGGTNSTSNPSTYTVEDTITLADPTIAPTGHSFAGWTLNDETITTIQKGTYGNLTLVANWSINSYNVTVTSSDETKGTVSGSGTYEYNSQVTVEATPATDCVFKGWYSDSEFATKVSSEATYTFTLSASDISLYAKFRTQVEEEEAWPKEHGVIPVVDTTNNQVTYGLYPQTVVNDSALLTALNALDDSSINSKNGWYFYNNEYYAKVTAKPFWSDYVFNNGNTIVEGTTYWFLCEAITWDILSNSDGQYYLLSDVLLDAHCYHLLESDRNVNGSTVYANNYQYSDIRAWLNNDFYNTAFALENTHIQTTEVDNSAATISSSDNEFACDNTNDKVFLPSYQDYKNSSYGFDTSNGASSTRECQTTDYARARGASYNSSYLYNGYYWTRSPYNNYSNHAWHVGYNGSLFHTFVDNPGGSVRPSLSLLIS